MAVESTNLTCCGNEDFRQYKDSHDAMIGQICKNCGAEWLRRNFLSSPSGSDLPDSGLPDSNYLVRNSL